MDNKIKVSVEAEGIDINILIDKEMKKWSSPYTSLCFQLRGKPVTEEQALDIISMTDDIFVHNSDYPFKNTIPVYNLENNWFKGGYGWVRPDGFVGINISTYFTGRTDIRSLTRELAYLLIKAPYLDIVIGMAGWGDMLPSLYDRECGYDISGEGDSSDMRALEKKQSYEKKEGFTENLEIGAWVHNRVIEIMAPERAAEVYKEYERLYGGNDHRVFSRYYCGDYMPDTVDYNYLVKCVSRQGYKRPEAVIAQAVKYYEAEHLKGFVYDE